MSEPPLRSQRQPYAPAHLLAISTGSTGRPDFSHAASVRAHSGCRPNLKKMGRGADEYYGAASQVRGTSAGQYAWGPIKRRHAGLPLIAPQLSIHRFLKHRVPFSLEHQPLGNGQKAAPRGWSCDDTSPGASDDTGIDPLAELTLDGSAFAVALEQRRSSGGSPNWQSAKGLASFEQSPIARIAGRYLVMALVGQFGRNSRLSELRGEADVQRACSNRPRMTLS